jgi:peptide/nickel transport system permease protein
MLRYLVAKGLSLVAVEFGITLVVFFLVRLVPGDIVDYLYGQYMSSERLDEVRGLFGLDRPAVVQYLDWLGGILHGDLGKSLLSGRPIVADIALRLPVTLELTAVAIAWSVPLAIVLGLVAARHPYGRIDGVVSAAGLLGLATPSFWLATLLVLGLSVHLKWFPAIGFVPMTDNVVESLRSITLPALCLGTTMAAAVMRMTRSAMLDVLARDYIRTARAKGLREMDVGRRHALKNALVPVLTIIGIETGKLLGGSLIIEQIFAIPGIGQYAASSVLTRDYPVLQATVLIVATFYVVINTLVDVSYVLVDPRITYG